MSTEYLYIDHQLFRDSAEEVSRSCGGMRDSSPEPKGRRSRGRHQRAGRQMRRQEIPVHQTMQPHREENQRGRWELQHIYDIYIYIYIFQTDDVSARLAKERYFIDVFSPKLNMF